MVTATYKVRTRDGRTVKMTGEIEDLDEITGIMQKAKAAPDLLAALEAHVLDHDIAANDLRKEAGFEDATGGCDCDLCIKSKAAIAAAK